MSNEVDKDYEALVEDYEDALMRLILYRVAREDGKRLLQEAEELEKSGVEVPRELDEACLKLIKEGCASQKRSQTPSAEGAGASRRHGHRLFAVARAAVIAVLAAALLFCAAYALNERFRVGVLNFSLELRENGSWFFFQRGETGEVEANRPQASGAEGEFPFEFTYIPEGYELFDRETYVLGADGHGYYCGYFTTEDPPHQFYFDISPVSEGTGLFVDTENAVVTEMTIRGHDGWLIEKTEFTSQRNSIKYLWFDLERGYSFHYASVGISPEESQKIFDGIVISDYF